jgi:hypothetical protein
MVLKEVEGMMVGMLLLKFFLWDVQYLWEYLTFVFFLLMSENSR